MILSRRKCEQDSLVGKSRNSPLKSFLCSRSHFAKASAHFQQFLLRCLGSSGDIFVNRFRSFPCWHRDWLSSPNAKVTDSGGQASKSSRALTVAARFTAGFAIIAPHPLEEVPKNKRDEVATIAQTHRKPSTSPTSHFNLFEISSSRRNVMLCWPFSSLKSMDL